MENVLQLAKQILTEVNNGTRAFDRKQARIFGTESWHIMQVADIMATIECEGMDDKWIKELTSDVNAIL